MQINEYNCAVKHFKKHDVSIYNMMQIFGKQELKQKRNYFAALTSSIIGQQLSVQSAKAILLKFNAHFAKKFSPETISKSSIETLRSLGLSNAKAKYIKDLAGKLLSGEVSLKKISTKSEEEIEIELTKVKGIGPWTVDMFLMFVLGKPNILPVGDLGIKKAIMLNYNLKNMPTSDKVLKIAKINNWAPYNTYASLYLWKSLEK